MTKSIIRFFSNAISVLFHPLLMLTYILVLLLLANPFLFGIRHYSEGGKLFLIVFLYTYLYPSFAVLMMKALGMIDSLEMKTKNERIGPFIATGIFYLWFFRNIYSDPNMPVAYVAAVLGATIGLFSAFFINLFYKISLHAVGVGGLIGVAFITVTFFSYGIMPLDKLGMMQVNTYYLLFVTILISGLVGTSRLILKAHRPQEIYLGYLLGLATQLLAIKILF
jgi:hypothetical protein